MSCRGLVTVVALLLLDVALTYGGADSPPSEVDRANRLDVIDVRGGLLTVTVQRSPLSSVLAAIARQTGVTIRSHAPIGDAITVNLRDVPVDEALTRVLGTRSAVFIYASDAATGDRPGLVEVHIYSGPAASSATTPTPLTARAARGAPHDSVVEVANDSRTDGAATRAFRGGGDPPMLGQSSWAIGSLIRALANEPDPSVRARAARTLGTIGGDEAIAPLAASIATDPDTAVREAAAAGLGRTWSDRAITPLAQALLDDQRFFVREAAAKALGETWSEGAVNALARALAADSRQSVRQSAAEALGRIGSLGAIDVLVAALGDGHSTVRESAAAALGSIGRREALGALIQASVSDEDSWVRQSAEQAVVKIMRAN